MKGSQNLLKRRIHTGIFGLISASRNLKRVSSAFLSSASPFESKRPTVSMKSAEMFVFPIDIEYF